MRRLLMLITATACSFTFAGASSGQAQDHRAKDKKKPTTTSRSRPGKVVAAGPVSVGNFVLTPPKAWKAKSGGTGIRKAQFILPRVKGDPEDGELVVFYFGPRGAGSADANLARWSQMVQKPKGMSDADYKQRKNLKIAGLDVTTLELHGTYTPATFGAPPKQPKTGYAMFAAVIETRNGAYYLRAAGPQATMQHWKKDYVAMLHGLKRNKGVGEI